MSSIIPSLDLFSTITLLYFFGINAAYLALVIISFFYIRAQLKKKQVFGLSGIFRSELYKPVSILAPAYNESATIIESLESLLQLQFPDYEVVVINDGSTDDTLEKLINHFDLKEIQRYVPLIVDHKPIRAIYASPNHPNLVVVDKENGRKADALNAGINVASRELVCAIDSDSVLEPDVLLKLLRAFVENEDTIAVGGIVRVANDCTIENGVVKKVRTPKSFLGRVQAVEYLRAFLFGRVGWDYMESLLIISGAFGVFDRDAVLKVGGYLHDTVGEDMELVVRLHRYHIENEIPYSIRFLPEPVCWTEVPEDWQALGRQRNRWQRGLADTLWRHRQMLFNPRYGRLGMIAMPFFTIFEALGPIIEIAGYAYFTYVMIMGQVNSMFAFMFFTAAILFGMILSISSVICEEFTFRRYPNISDVFILSIYAFLENFGYRQIHSWWRFKGLIDFLKGNKEWGVMTRKGLGTANNKTNSTTEKTAEKSTKQWLPEWIKLVPYWSVSVLMLVFTAILLYQAVITTQ